MYFIIELAMSKNRVWCLIYSNRFEDDIYPTRSRPTSEVFPPASPASFTSIHLPISTHNRISRHQSPAQLRPSSRGEPPLNPNPNVRRPSNESIPQSSSSPPSKPLTQPSSVSSSSPSPIRRQNHHNHDPRAILLVHAPQVLRLGRPRASRAVLVRHHRCRRSHWHAHCASYQTLLWRR